MLGTGGKCTTDHNGFVGCDGKELISRQMRNRDRINVFVSERKERPSLRLGLLLFHYIRRRICVTQLHSTLPQSEYRTYISIIIVQVGSQSRFSTSSSIHLLLFFQATTPSPIHKIEPENPAFRHSSPTCGIYSYNACLNPEQEGK